MLIDLIEGRDVDERAVLPTEMVIRQSCGCLGQVRQLPTVRQEEVDAVADVLEIHREEIIAALLQFASNVRWDLGFEQATQLLDAFGSSLEQQNAQVFLQVLEKGLRRTVMQNDDPTRWHDALHILHHHTLPHLHDCQMVCSITTFAQASD
jgi:hypothetical protein